MHLHRVSSVVSALYVRPTAGKQDSELREYDPCAENWYVRIEEVYDMPCLEIFRTAVLLKSSSMYIVKIFICSHVLSHVRDRLLCLGPDYPAILYRHHGQLSC
jgi:hypothetical protein